MFCQFVYSWEPPRHLHSRNSFPGKASMGFPQVPSSRAHWSSSAFGAKTRGWKVRNNWVFTVSVCATQNTYSLQSEKDNFMMKKPGRYHHNQGKKLPSITSNMTNRHHVRCYATLRETQYPFQRCFCQMCTYLNLTVRKKSGRPKPGHMSHKC